MKKQFLSLALIAGMIGSIAAGCSASKNAGDSDTTAKKDSTTMSSPTNPSATDTTKKDTSMKKDTTHH